MNAETAPAAPPHDAAFEKYRQEGAYHWRNIGRHWWHHQAFTMERYRRTLAACGPLAGKKVADVGCGDGALLGLLAKAVGPGGTAYGIEPNDLGRRLAGEMLGAKGLKPSLHASLDELPPGTLDGVICAEVIEHVHEPLKLLADIARVLRPGGVAVVTTPIRLTERPEDRNHIREWYFDEFAAFLATGPLKLARHEASIPIGAVEAYFSRPWCTLRVPVVRVLCNVLSIHGGINALTWLKMRPRLFLQQIATLEKPAA